MSSILYNLLDFYLGITYLSYVMLINPLLMKSNKIPTNEKIYLGILVILSLIYFYIDSPLPL